MGRRKGSENKSKAEIRALIDRVSELARQGNRDGLELALEGILRKAIGSDQVPADPAAAKLLLEYRFGKPKEMVGLSLEENEQGEKPEIVVMTPGFTKKSPDG